MGYYMRYFVPPSAQKVTLTAISAMLTTLDSLYTIQIDPADTSLGELFYAERNLGEIEINQKDDEIFEEEIEDFLELLNYHSDDQKDGVISAVESAQQIVAVSAIWRDGDADDADGVHDLLDPLWDWLDAQCNGMLHRDADGFYLGEKLILEMNVRL